MEYLVTSNIAKILGRTKMVEDVLYMNYSLSSIEFNFTGKKVEAVILSDVEHWQPPYYAWMAVFIDDEITPSKRFCLTKKTGNYVLFESERTETVTVRLVKLSEAAYANVGVKCICIGEGDTISPTNKRNRTIEFIGDSITCGYGNEGVWNRDTFTTAQENPLEGYAGRTAKALDADCQLVSWSGIGVLSSYTEQDEPATELLMPELYQYTDLGLEKSLHNKNPELWNSTSFVPDIIVVNLGTNDNSYCKGRKERVEAFGRTYFEFLSDIRIKNENAMILCTLGAMGQELCDEVERQVRIFKELKKDSFIDTMRFDVQEEKDGIGTDWHPNITTHIHMANKLINKIKEIMRW